MAPRGRCQRAGKEGYPSPLERTQDENAGAYWWKTTEGLKLQKVGTASSSSSMFLLILIVSLGTVGARVGTRLQQFSDGQPLMQGRLTSRHEQVLDFT